MNAETLAREFSRLLAGEIGLVRLGRIIERNATEADTRICHSHDYCDANQVMLDAMALINLGELDTQDEQQMTLINSAWSIAKQNEFFAAY